jgi:hypothetical protein
MLWLYNSFTCLWCVSVQQLRLRNMGHGVVNSRQGGYVAKSAMYHNSTSPVLHSNVCVSGLLHSLQEPGGCCVHQQAARSSRPR